MGLRQYGIKEVAKHVIYHWKAYFSGNQKNHVSKAKNVIFDNYSSPLQRHSLSNKDFLENFLWTLKENIFLYTTSNINTIFA